MGWAAAGGAGLAVTTLAMVGLPGRRLLLLPVLVVATAATAVGAALSVRAVPVPVLASSLLVVDVLLAATASWVAVGRISRPGSRVDLEVLAAEARVARELLVGLTVGLVTVQVALTPVVACAGTTGVALAGCASAFTLLRARHTAPPAVVLPAVVAGAVSLIATAGVGLWLHESWRPAGSWVLVGAGGVLLAVPSTFGGTLLLRPTLQVVETGCLVALLPLLVVLARVWELVP
jgi:hypothetical protein